MDTFSRNWPDVRVEDIYYVVGNSSPSWRRFERLRKARWYKKVAGSLRPLLVEHALSEVYNRFTRRHGHEPAWMARLSPNMRRDIRHLWITGDSFDPLWIISYRRGMGFSFGVREGGFIHDVAAALNVFRLGEIRQLGFLHDPVVNNDTADIGMAENFHHTRLLHSSTVMATAGLLAHRLGLSQPLTQHLLVAALTHDIRTPAGGDSVKPVDPSGLDEDAHYPEAFKNNPEWDEVRRRYRLDESALARIIRGEGILGQLLDIADKTTYVDHDLDAYLKWNDPRKFRRLVPPPGFVEIWNLRQELGQKACRLWDCVEILGGKVVVTDPDRLAGFLRIRALLFKHLYFNPRARYREQMLGLLVLDPLYHEGLITREELIAMVDHQLWNWLNKTAGSDLREHLSYSHLAPVIESFGTEQEATDRIAALHGEDPTLLFMVETFPKPSKKAVQMLVRDQDGQVRTFVEACPKAAEEILAIGNDPRPTKLYILEKWKIDRVLSPDLCEKLYARQRERFGLG